jgi:hypothetical protein
MLDPDPLALTSDAPVLDDFTRGAFIFDFGEYYLTRQ